MALPIYVLMLVILQVVHGSEKVKREGLMDHLSNGMKFAQDFLGSESVATKVAEFVVRAFQPNTRKPARRRPYNEAYSDVSSEETNQDRPENDINEAPSPMSPLKHLVRLFGLQPNQISAVAVNALVFVAQMISTFLSGPKRPSRPYRSDDPTSWILNKNSRRLQDLIDTAKNETLSDDIDDMIKEQGFEETSCIRLLVCKITPFVNKMQKAVFGNNNKIDFDEKLKGSAALYKYLPSAEEISNRDDICERKHRDCDLNE